MSEKSKWQELVDAEIKRQNEKWGVQDVPPWWWLLYIIEEVGELAQSICHTFGDKEPNPTAKGNVLKELVQVGALCEAMYEAGLRNNWWLHHQGEEIAPHSGTRR